MLHSSRYWQVSIREWNFVVCEESINLFSFVSAWSFKVQSLVLKIAASVSVVGEADMAGLLLDMNLRSQKYTVLLIALLIWIYYGRKNWSRLYSEYLLRGLFLQTPACTSQSEITFSEHPSSAVIVPPTWPVSGTCWLPSVKMTFPLYIYVVLKPKLGKRKNYEL